MEATKEDSKQEETQASSEKSAEKKESGTEEGTSQKTYTEEEIEKLKKKATDFDALVAKLALEKKERSAEFEKEQKPQDDSESGDVYDDTRKIVHEELAKTELKKAEQNFNNALDKFVRKHPEYSPEHDVLDLNWKKIKLHVDELKHGVYRGSEDGYFERLELIHNGIKNPKTEISESKTETVEDSGVGNITSQPKSKEKKPDALTRPLNEHEKESMMNFPGKTLEEKEKGYRAKLAELETRRRK